ncbi:MAG TPA: ATP synthase subunit I [Elusimicrobiales bacterium]|nr:ATP synthase subunit I [Elusimicrobiales bacterium]
MKLEDIVPGAVLNYNGGVWRVMEKSVCRESAAYVEVQWTLESNSGGEAYLLRSEEKKEDGTEVLWVFTRQTQLHKVSFEAAPGSLKPFAELDMPSAPPAHVNFANDKFSFQDETSGEAEDDEGDTVTKITWNYYSSDHKRNLAIEIWKEPDRDYPEAYDGLVVPPSAFEIRAETFTVSRGGARGGGMSGDASNTAFMVGIIGFFALLAGLAVDSLFFLGLPFAVVMLMVVQRPPLWLWLSSAGVWAGVAVLAAGKGMGLSFWYLTGVCAALSVVLPRLIAASFSGVTAARYYRVALYGVLPALWVYSFLEYFLYAPGPRAFYQFFAACLLPLTAAGLCWLLGKISERPGEPDA